MGLVAVLEVVRTEVYRGRIACLLPGFVVQERFCIRKLAMSWRFCCPAYDTAAIWQRYKR